MRIRLTPFDGDLLRVHWRIGGDNHYFFSSCVMGSQFSAFLRAVYLLYEEEMRVHCYHIRKEDKFKHEYPFNREDKKHLLSSTVCWDGEGPFCTITFVRICDDANVPKTDTADPIQITIEGTRNSGHYTVDGRDLCYAVARGCTEAIKKYGLSGYRESTGMQYPGDSFNLHELLFIKAYALNALDSREMKVLWEHPRSWPRARASSFEKELELLLFDM